MKMAYCFYLKAHIYHDNFCDLFVIFVQAALCETMVTRLRRIHQIENCQKYCFSAQSQKIAKYLNKSFFVEFSKPHNRRYETILLFRSSYKYATVKLNASINPVDL